MRSSIWLVTLGVIFALISGMVSVAETRYAADHATTPTHFGMLVASLGGILFGIGILIEFFQIGTAIRKMAEKA